MEKHIQVVIIDLDTTSNRTIQVILQEIPGVEVKTEMSDLTKGVNLIKEVNPAIVILNLYPSEEAAFRIAKKITQGFPETTLIITSRQTDSKIVIKSMRVGAREFLLQPIVKEELISAVKTVIRAKKQTLPNKKYKGKIITCFGSKGGVGTTTVASNMAISLANYTKKNVVVVDLNLQMGNTAMALDMKPKYTIMDVANNIDSIDVPILKTMLPKNSANITLMASPFKIEEAESINPGHIEQILLLLKNVYDYIIIDTRSCFDDVNIKAMDESEYVLAITTLDVPSVVNTIRCIDLFQKMGYKEDKVLLVINRHASHPDIDLEAIEKQLGYPIFWRIPNQDYKNIILSVNKGIPLSQMMPNAKLSQNIIKMIKNFNGKLYMEEQTEKKGKTRLLKKILK